MFDPYDGSGGFALTASQDGQGKWLATGVHQEVALAKGVEYQLTAYVRVPTAVGLASSESSAVVAHIGVSPYLALDVTRSMTAWTQVYGRFVVPASASATTLATLDLRMETTKNSAVLDTNTASQVEVYVDR